MTITTKYEKGQELFSMNKNKVETRKFDSIKFLFLPDDFKPCISYGYCDKQPNGQDCERQWLYEWHVFATKEELLASL